MKAFLWDLFVGVGAACGIISYLYIIFNPKIKKALELDEEEE